MTDLMGSALPFQGRYRLGAPLGRGAMGAVYRAIDRLSGETVALKTIALPDRQLEFASRAGDDTPDQVRLALAREFRSLAALRHPNIIDVRDYGFDAQQRPFFTMTMLEGAQTIVEAAAGQTLAAQTHLLIQALQALVYLHRQSVLHRDLKPGNILVTPDGRVRLLDFGLCADLAHVAGTAGTLAYMAPEVLKNQPLSQASDLYALGVVACQVYTGRYPYQAQHPAQLIADILRQPPDLTPLAHAPLAGVLSIWLEKRPQRRYQDATQVIDALCRAVDLPLPDESEAIRESFIQAAAFVGREAELAQLGGALERAAAGQGTAWLVGGESGVGKSRLVDELRTRALVDGFRVVRGQAVPSGGAPYYLWQEPLRHLALNTALSDLELGILEAAVPGLSRPLERNVPALPDLSGTAQQQRFGLTVTDLFRRQGRPTLLLLEDLHWVADHANRECLAPLESLARLVGHLPLLIVASYRDDECPHLPEFVPATGVISLARFSQAQVARLSESMLGEQGCHPQVLELLHRETEGNAFFLVEAVRALSEQAGRLERVGTTALPEHVVSGGIQAVVRRRLARAPEAIRPMLKLAAVAGREIDLRVLHRAAPEADLERQLVAAASVAVLEVQDGGWRFAHDKLREALLDDLDADERVGLHHQVAEAIEALYPGDPRYALNLAGHWHLAGQPARALPYVRASGEALLNTSSYAGALRLIEQSLQAIEQTADQTLAGEKPWLLNLAGSAHLGLSNFAAAQSCFESALNEARTPDNAADAARAWLGLGQAALNQGHYAQAHTCFKDSLSISNKINNQKWIIASLIWLGRTHRYLGDFRAAGDCYRESLSLAQEIGDQFNIAGALNGLGVVAICLGDYAQARACYEQSLAVRQAIGDREGIANTLFNLGDVSNNEGNYRLAQTFLEPSLQRYREIGSRQGEAYSLIGLGNAAIYRGEYASAQQYLQASLSIRREIGDQTGIAACLKSLGNLAVRRGHLEQAETYFQDYLALSRDLGNRYGIAIAHLGLGQTAGARGDHARAAQCLEYALEHYRALDDPPGIAAALLDLGDLAHRQGQTAQARAYYESSLALYRSLNSLIGIALCRCHLAFIDIAEGRLARARDALLESLTIARQTGIMPLELQAVLGCAWIKALEGQPEQSAALLELIAAHPRYADDRAAQARWMLVKHKSASFVSPAPMDSTQAHGAAGDWNAATAALLDEMVE